MRSVGIDIGRNSIKVVEVLASNRTYEITKAKEYKILNMESSDQEIDILQTLHTISKEFDTESAKTICSIRQQYISSRKVFFPFKERMKIHKSLAFELEDDIPLTIDKAIYDSKIIKFHEKSAEVVAMACVREEIEKTLDIMERGHIDPDVITPEFCAIANLYEKWYKAPDSVTEETNESTEPDKLVVHIGHSKTFAGVVSRGYLVWGRSIMWGAEKVAAAISNTFQVPFTTAHDMMPDKAFVLLSTADASKEHIKMSEAVTKAFEPLIQSLRLTIMLANTDYGTNVSEVELIGSPSKIKNIAPYFTQELEKSTNISNPAHHFSDRHIKNHERLGDAFLMALGLSIEGLRRPFNPPVNFRQMEYAKKNLSFEKFWEKWGYTAKLVAAGYFCYVVYAVAIDTVSTQLEQASYDVMMNQASKIAKLKGRSATPGKIKAFIRDKNKEADLVKVYDQLDEINSPMKFINEISQILPPNKDNESFDVRRMMIKDRQITLQGVAKSDEIIKSIDKALKGVALNGKVSKAPATIPDEPGKKKFGFKFNVKRKN